MSVSRDQTTLDAVGGTVAIAGEDAERPSLSASTRAVVAVAAASDVAMRTFAASALTAAALPWWLTHTDLRRERRRLEYYTRFAGNDRAFEPPPAKVAIAARPERDRRLKAPGGRIELLRFRSPYVALHPELRRTYAGYQRNVIAGAQYWRHSGAARPTLIVLHGYFASPFWFNSAFFALPWFYHQGYDVLLFVMPFHGPRQERLSPFNGSGLISHGFAHLNEVIAQAVCDLRVLLGHLQRRDVPSVAMTGLSLGGYMTALMATLEPALGAVIPNAPVTDLADISRLWWPLSWLVSAAGAIGGASREEFDASLAFHSPLRRTPLVPWERRMIIGGLGDRLAPPSHARALWERWERPRLHWYPGNHTLHVNRGAYLKEMRAFMSDNGVLGTR